MVRARQAQAAAENLAQIEENAARRAAEKRQEREEGLAAMQTLVTPGAGMGFLAESAGDAVHSLGPHRIRKDYYRGRASGHPDAVRESYAAQMETRIRERQAAAEREARLAEEYQAGVLAAKKVEREAKEARARAAAETAAALEKQRQEQAAAKAMDKERHREHGFGKEFFEAFGKTDF